MYKVTGYEGNNVKCRFINLLSVILLALNHFKMLWNTYIFLTLISKLTFHGLFFFFFYFLLILFGITIIAL